MDEVTSPLFKRKLRNRKSVVLQNLSQNWYTLECSDKRKIFYRSLNKYRQNKSEENRLNMVKTRTEYKLYTKSKI